MRASNSLEKKNSVLNEFCERYRYGMEYIVHTEYEIQIDYSKIKDYC